ncbi:hypothetical protein NEIG_02348 [Nematocida sp. ERTm5]|nr:hypothetical protein NEIG_02348 [Nematocida sp. ERTm5]
MEKKSVRIFLILYILVCLAGIGIIFATKENSLEVENRDVNNPVLETKYEACLEIKDVEEESSASPERSPERPSTSTQSILNRSALNTEHMAPHTNLNTETLLNVKEQEQPVRETIPSIFVTTETEISTENVPNTEPVFTKYNDSNELIKRESEISDIENKTSSNPMENNSQELVPVPMRSPEEELIEMLECIVKRNPSLASKTQKIYNDIYIINALLMNRNTVVLENFRLSSINVVEKITLWEVLQACKEGRSIDIDASSLDPIDRVTFFYPQNLMYNPFVVHAMLTYYNPNNISNISLSLLQFDFQFSKNIFNEFQIFKIVKKLIISRTVIHTNTLNTLKDFSNLKELSLFRGTILNSDGTDDIASLPKNLERLLLFGIDNDNVNWALAGLSSCHNLYEISISNIDFMDTYALNNLKDFGNVALFSLRNIVFTGCPNFSFLEKMSMVKKLTMRNIFYSYTEKFKVNDLDRIKQNIMYLIPESTEKNVLDEYLDIVNRNKEVGSCIYFTNIDIDSKLYSDLELHKIEPREWKKHTIRIEFVNNIDYFGLNSIGIEFILNDLQYWLDINTMPQTTVVTEALLLESLQCIKFPFLDIRTINTITLKNSLNNVFKESAIMNILSDQIMKYAKNNWVTTLNMVSLVPSVTIDIYKIILFNRNMRDLANLNLFSVGFDPGSTEYKNSNETSNIECYKKYIQKNPNGKFWTFIRIENILKFA